MDDGKEKNCASEGPSNSLMISETNLRVSKRIQSRRKSDRVGGKRAKGGDFLYDQEEELDSVDEIEDREKSKRKRADTEYSTDQELQGPNYVQGRKRKMFDYDTVLAGLKQGKERVPLNFSKSMKPSYDSSSSHFSKYSAKIAAQRSRTDLAETSSRGTPSNNIAIMKQNIDLKYENQRLSRENKLLKTRVNVVLDLLVQRTSQLKLLKMACIDKDVSKKAPTE